MAQASPKLATQPRLLQPALAASIAEKLRNQKSAGGRAGIVQGLLQEFSLSSQEGVALMCLAEALLRVLEPYGIKEMAQSGLLAIGRGSKSITYESLCGACYLQESHGVLNGRAHTTA